MSNNIGKNLAALRQRAGYSRREIAAAIGVGDRTIGAYERGEKTPSIDKLIQLADFFGVSIDELIRGNVEGEIRDNVSKVAEKRQALYNFVLGLSPQKLTLLGSLVEAVAEVAEQPLDEGGKADYNFAVTIKKTGETADDAQILKGETNE